MKQEGIFILTVLICFEEKTKEDFNINTEQERIKEYGQKDHVRLYGNDTVERIEKFGFKVTLYRNVQMDEECIKKMGYLHKDSVLICKKI